MRVLNLWQKNGVFKIEVIQPLLDMAAGNSSAAAPFTGTDDPGNFCVLCKFESTLSIFNILRIFMTHDQTTSILSGSPSPAKEPVAAVTANSTLTSAPQLHNTDAFAAVAQLFQSSQGQQVCVHSRVT